MENRNSVKKQKPFFFSYFLALPQKVTKKSRPPNTSTRPATFLKFLQKRVNFFREISKNVTFTPGPARLAVIAHPARL
jgi:hypothetical protein